MRMAQSSLSNQTETLFFFEFKKKERSFVSICKEIFVRLISYIFEKMGKREGIIYKIDNIGK